MQTRWILGMGLVLGTWAAATAGCQPDPHGGTGGAGGSTGTTSPDGGNLPTTSSSSSSTSSASSGGTDRCHRTGVVASCNRPPNMGSARVCDEVFDQAQATSLMQGCASAGDQYSTGPCDRAGSIGFCAGPDLGGEPGDDRYVYDANLASLAQSQCMGPLMGTWCPLP